MEKERKRGNVHENTMREGCERELMLNIFHPVLHLLIVYTEWSDYFHKIRKVCGKMRKRKEDFACDF